MVLGPLVNDMATMLSFVVFTQLAPLVDLSVPPAHTVATALLGGALAADAVAIGFMGLGLVLLGSAMAQDESFGRGLGGMGIVAGLAVMPMGFEAGHDWAAQWVLWGSIPLFAWLLWLAVKLWRLPAARGQAPL